VQPGGNLIGAAGNKPVIRRAFDAWAAGTYHGREEFLAQVIRPCNARLATSLVPKVHACTPTATR
jgi:hypothetical protein